MRPLSTSPCPSSKEVFPTQPALWSTSTKITPSRGKNGNSSSTKGELLQNKHRGPGPNGSLPIPLIYSMPEELLKELDAIIA
jgi:hypothetical protein